MVEAADNVSDDVSGGKFVVLSMAEHLQWNDYWESDLYFEKKIQADAMSIKSILARNAVTLVLKGRISNELKLVRYWLGVVNAMWSH